MTTSIISPVHHASAGRVRAGLRRARRHGAGRGPGALRVSLPGALLIVASVLLPAPGQALTDRPYDIEIVLVRHLYEAGSEELWEWPARGPDGTELAVESFSDLEAAERVGTEEADTGEEELDPLLVPRLLDEEELQMQTVVRRLRNSANFRPIHHEGWRVHLDNRANALPYAVRALDNPYEVSGDITVAAERKLHVRLELRMEGDGNTYVLEQARTLRRKDIHYFDHPKFGVLMRITRPPLEEDG